MGDEMRKWGKTQRERERGSLNYPATRQAKVCAHTFRPRKRSSELSPFVRVLPIDRLPGGKYSSAAAILTDSRVRPINTRLIEFPSLADPPAAPCTNTNFKVKSERERERGGEKTDEF